MKEHTIAGMLDVLQMERECLGLQFLSALTKKSHAELKSELIKRAGSFQNVLNTEDTVKSNKKQNINESNAINNLFGDLLETHKKSESLKQQKLLDNDWSVLPEWVEKEVAKRKIYDSPFIKSDWELYYDNHTNRLVIPWTDEYYQLRALTKQQEKESGKYLFPPEIEKPIFGLDMIDTSFKYLFLLERGF
jgi:hypothetical protein